MDWETFKKPIILCHRGFAKDFPENSLDAVEAAIELGADGSEVDLQFTKDGEIVLSHDSWPEKMTLAQIRQRLGPRVATLDELLEVVRGRSLLNLEIKNNRIFSPKMEEKIVSSLKNYPVETLLISSFNPFSIWRFKRLLPSIRRGFLFIDRREWTISIASPFIDPYSINIPLALMSASLVEEIHKTGRKVFVWTVNRDDDIKRAVQFGVDGIFTDEADRLLKIFQRTRKT